MELLVVLVILAIMTTIAVQSTDMLVDQGRYNATQQTLQNIQAAVLGPAGQIQPNGIPQITGFVADMGRLPIAVADLRTGNPSLRELYDSTALPTVPAYQNQPVTVSWTGLPSSYTMTLPCGWRGPYLRLPGGSAGRLVDGWGNPFDLLSTTSGITTPLGSTIDLVRSRGADGQVDSIPLASGFPPYNQDQYVPDQTYTTVSGNLVLNTPLNTFSTQALNTTAATGNTVNVQVLYLASMTGATGSFSVPSNPLSTDGTVSIVLLEPVNGTLVPFSSTGTAINWVTIPAGSTPPASGLSSTGTPIRRYDFTSPTTTVSCTFSFVTIGPRAIQAFQPSATPAARKSPYTPIMMPNGGLPPITLIVQ